MIIPKSSSGRVSRVSHTLARPAHWPRRRRTDASKRVKLLSSMEDIIPLPLKRAFGKKKRTTKEERKHQTQAARIAFLSNAGACTSSPSKENEPMSPKTSREDMMKEKKRLRERARYWETDARIKRQKLDEQTATVHAQEKIIAEHQQADVQYAERMQSLHTRIKGLERQKTGYQQKLHTLTERCRRATARLGKAVSAVLGSVLPTATAAPSATYQHKQRGVVSNDSRDCFTDLMALDHIPAKHVASAFKRVAACLGITVEDDVDRRSMRRFTKEAGVAAKLQFMEAAHDAAGENYFG